MARELKIDLDISAALPPLTPEEWNSLSKNISEDRKVIEPLIVWKGRDIIVDGHHRWKAINEFGITDYKIEEKEFADIDEAIIWLLKHQKGRRNIGPNQLTVLIGKAYERQKQKRGGSREGSGRKPKKSKDQADPLIKPYEVEVIPSPDDSAKPYEVEVMPSPDDSAESYEVEVIYQQDEEGSPTEVAVAEVYDVSTATVQRAVQFVEVLKEIEEKTSPEIVRQIITAPEKTPITHLTVIKEELDENPEIIKDYQAMTPHQRAKYTAFCRGVAYLNSKESQEEIAAKFKTDRRTLFKDIEFAKLVIEVNKINPDLADWIMKSESFPMSKMSELIDEGGLPMYSAIEYIKGWIEKGRSFNDAMKEWEDYKKAKEVSKGLTEVIAKADKETAEIFQGASSICFPPTIRKLFCKGCEWGFDTYLPEPASVSCPYCRGEQIIERSKNWNSRK